MRCIAKVLSRIAHSLFRGSNETAALSYWRQRAKRGGLQAVLNSGYLPQDFARITQKQKDMLFPFLKQYLRGDERLVLDFGCGPGRFSADLARTTGANVVAVDPIRHFLRIAAKDKHVTYTYMRPGHIPLSAACADVVWICLVLGGLADGRILQKTLLELDRVLKPGGLIFLVENTAEKPDCNYWHYRPVKRYQEFFRFASLQPVGEYEELGECISVMAGRKQGA